MVDIRIGALTEKYETGNKGPGFISNGSKWGDPGGDSYGAYQLESKLGTLQDYIAYNDKFSGLLRDLKINSEGFKQKWKQLAKEDPQGFKQSQFDFLCTKKGGYNSGINYAKELGWAVDHIALQAAIFSTVNQSGGWRKGIFDRANIKPKDPIKVQIDKLYDARARYFISLSSLSSTIKRNIIKERTVNERADALRLI